MKDTFKVVHVDKDVTGMKMDETRKEIESAGGTLVNISSVTADEIIEAAKDADIIITVAANISRKVMESLPKLKAVVRFGVGYDTVDVDAATDNGVVVVNIPDFCWEEVANQVIMFILTNSKKTILLNDLVKQGRWADAKKAEVPMASVHEETLGIIGCGRIGQTVAKKAKCFDMNIIGYDKYLPKEIAEEAGITLVSLEELLKKSDYITIHTALTPETRHMIGESQFKMMKPNAMIINTSRGPTIDESAMIKALQQGVIASAGLDVFEQEPIDPNNPLLKMDNVIVTPHSASYSEAAFSRLRTSVGKEAARVGLGQKPKSIVNKSVKPKVNLV